MVSTGVRDAVLLVGLVLVWFLGNFKFGFLLNSSKAQLTQTPAFLVALWGILMVGTALPSAMLAALYVTQRTTDQHASELVKPFDSAAVAYRSTPYFVVFCHLLGVAFTCFAFVVGSVSSVQVLKSLAPVFSALLSSAYLDSAVPKQAIFPVVSLAMGAALSSYKSPPSSFAAFMLCMTTNLAIPYRNVLLKQAIPNNQAQGLPTVHVEIRQSSRAELLAAALQRLTALNGNALIWITVVCCIFLPDLDVLNRRTCLLALHLGLWRTSYELASLMVLMQVDPVVHSSLDVLKRAGMTVLDLSNTMLTHPIGLLGTALAFTSLLWYKVVSKRQTPKPGSEAGGLINLNSRQREVIGTCARNLLFMLAVAGVRVMRTSAALQS